MKRCRMVLWSVAAADEDQVFFNLLAKPVLKPNDPDDTGVLRYPAMVSCLLDFRTIDLRLAAGFYVASHETFIEDAREVWQILRIAYHDRPDDIELVETLSKKFEELYEEEVHNLVSKIMESGNSLDSSSEEEKKELNSLVVETMESSLPAAPWEDGVQSITQDERCGTRALSRLCGKKKFQKEFTRNLLEKLAPLADTMELMEYWELGVEERVFLFKILCDEVLSSVVVRNHLAPDSGDLEKEELKSQNKREEILASNLAKEVEDKSQEDYLSASKSSDAQSQIQNEEHDENRNAGQDQESVSEVKESVSSLHYKKKLQIWNRKLLNPQFEEYLGRDLVGRLYRVLSSADRVVISSPRSIREASPNSSSLLSRLNECEISDMCPSDDSMWTCYKSITEILDLIGG